MTQDTDGSVTRIIISIRGGDDANVAPLWERYFDRLTHHAARYLQFAPGLADNDEDVALSAIDAFCNGLAEGKFDYVDGREVLWGTLARITERKALQRLRDKRWRREVRFNDLLPDGSSDADGCSRIAVVRPTDEYVDLVRLELGDLIDSLKDPRWRQAARMVMEGYTVPEIAHRLGPCRETVYIWFRTIRAIWEEEPGRENLLG
jgi:hypothetical protein